MKVLNKVEIKSTQYEYKIEIRNKRIQDESITVTTISVLQFSTYTEALTKISSYMIKYRRCR